MALIVTQDLDGVAIIGDVAVAVTRILNDNRASIAIEAPRDVQVFRADIVERKLKEEGWKREGLMHWRKGEREEVVTDAWDEVMQREKELALIRLCEAMVKKGKEDTKESRLAASDALKQYMELMHDA